MRKLALLIACACLLAGCGGDENHAQTGGALTAYKQLYTAWKRNDDKAACAMMTPAYQHKLQAVLEAFDSECPALIVEIHKQVAGKDAIGQISVEPTDGPPGVSSVLVRNKLDGEIVRTRFDFKKQDGRWVAVGDRSLDATGPQAPVEAYRAQAKAKGESPEVLWSEASGPRARLWEVQGNGSGSYSLLQIDMAKEGDEWVVKSKKNLGTAPSTAIRDDGQVV